MAPNPSGSFTREDTHRGLQSIKHQHIQQHRGITRRNRFGREARQPTWTRGRNRPSCAQRRQRTSSSSFWVLPPRHGNRGDRRNPAASCNHKGEGKESTRRPTSQVARQQQAEQERQRVVERGQGRDQIKPTSAAQERQPSAAGSPNHGWMEGSLDATRGCVRGRVWAMEYGGVCSLSGSTSLLV